MKNVTNKKSTALFLATLIFLFGGCDSYRKSLDTTRSQNNDINEVSPSKPSKNATNPSNLSQNNTKENPTGSSSIIPSSTTIEFAASSSNDVDSVYWFERIHTFGDVPSGPPATTKFYFINKGNKPISISDVQAGCSCTATEFTKGLISPNDTGYVSAAYKTANTFGFFRKHVDVFFDHKEKKHHLILTGNVDPMRTK